MNSQHYGSRVHGKEQRVNYKFLVIVVTPDLKSKQHQELHR